jgi:hypothetical protein
MIHSNKSIFEAISAWPKWQQTVFGLLLCAFAAYYSIEVPLIALGQATVTLYDPIGVVINVSILMVCGGLGLLFRRPVVVGAILSVVGIGFLMQFALRSTGNPIGWIRQTLFYTMPLVNNLYFWRWLVSMRTPQPA